MEPHHSTFCGYISLRTFCHSILPTTQGVGAIIPNIQMRKLRLREARGWPKVIDNEQRVQLGSKRGRQTAKSCLILLLSGTFLYRCSRGQPINLVPPWQGRRGLA